MIVLNLYNRMENYSNIAAVVLAAGKGTRMHSENKNKVTHYLNDQPLILRIVKMFENLYLGSIIVVVGYARDSVITSLQGTQVIFADQEQQLGTGHATQLGFEKVSKGISDVIVIYGDDASMYPLTLLKEFINQHHKEKNVLTLVSFLVENPKGLGRILRKKNKIIGVVEEKNATEEQKKIKEINSGLYIFNKQFLQKYLPVIQVNSVSQEYYLTDLIEIAFKSNFKVGILRAGKLPWFGINTFADLEMAQKVYNQK